MVVQGTFNIFLWVSSKRTIKKKDYYSEKRPNCNYVVERFLVYDHEDCADNVCFILHTMLQSSCIDNVSQKKINTECDLVR